MGLFSFAKAAIKGVSKIASNPLVRGAASFLPGAAIGIAAAEGVSALTGGGGGPAPAPAPGLPALPPMPMMAPAMVTNGGYGGAGAVPMMAPAMTQGAARSMMRAPVFTSAQLQSMFAAGVAIPFGQLRTIRRAPKGYVVIHAPHESGGETFVGLDKRLARAWGLWKPARKPPISAGDWHAVGKANRVVRKFRNVERSIKKVANFHSRRPAPKTVAVVTRGKTVVGRKVGT